MTTPIIEDHLISSPPKAEVSPRVSIVLVAYNALANIEKCLASLRRQQYPDYEVIVVDNGSEDGSADYVERHFPEVRLIRAGHNLGFGGANNLGALNATGRYLAFLNLDTAVEPDWLSPLVQTLQENPSVALVTGKILLMNRPDRINTCGNDVHFAGFGYLRGWLEPAGTMNQPAEVSSVSGAAFVISRKHFIELGGFEDGFFPAYVEDTDLSWRARLMGYHCRYVPESVIYHDYTAGFSALKYYLLERNRYLMLLKNLNWRTLILLLPALLLSEVVGWGFALITGPQHIRAKLSSYWWLISHWDHILRRREIVQKSRRVPDHEIIGSCSLKLAAGQTGDGLIVKVSRRVFDPLFSVLFRFYLGVTGILEGTATHVEKSATRLEGPATTRLNESTMQDFAR